MPGLAWFAASLRRGASSSPSPTDGGATLGVRLPNWLGDAMLARRALDSLAALGGPANLLLVAPPAIASILTRDYPGARWLTTPGHGLEQARRIGLAFRQARVDRLVLFPDSFSSRVTAFYSGARERTGHGPHGANLEAGFALTKRVPRRRRGERHLEEEYLDLARAAGGEARP